MVMEDAVGSIDRRDALRAVTTQGRMNAVVQIRSAPPTSQRHSEQKDCYRIAVCRRDDLLSRDHRRLF